MQPKISYTIEVLHPVTGKPISLKVSRFDNWDQVQLQIFADKRQFVDMAKCTLKYSANDGTTVELTGSYGA